MLAKGNQWTKEMEMRLTDTDVVLLDGETQVNMEIIITCVWPMLGHMTVYVMILVSAEILVSTYKT